MQCFDTGLLYSEIKSFLHLLPHNDLETATTYTSYITLFTRDNKYISYSYKKHNSTLTIRIEVWRNHTISK